jgi:hypothetical protein
MLTLAWRENVKREMESEHREKRDRGWEMEFQICFSSLEWDITLGNLSAHQLTKV